MNANPNNDVAAIVRKYCDKIAFAHIRNVKHFENGDINDLIGTLLWLADDKASGFERVRSFPQTAFSPHIMADKDGRLSKKEVGVKIGKHQMYEKNFFIK